MFLLLTIFHTLVYLPHFAFDRDSSCSIVALVKYLFLEFYLMDQRSKVYVGKAYRVLEVFFVSLSLKGVNGTHCVVNLCDCLEGLLMTVM